MKQFLKSKLVLSLGALVMIAALAVPLASSITRLHAAGPSEQHHSIRPTTVIQQIDPITNITKAVITTDQPCSNATSIASSLQPGDQVSIVATETTTDSNEASEQEFLTLQDTAHNFSQAVNAFNEITPMVFNVVSPNDQLTACIQPGADGPDGDEQGLITFTIAHAKTLVLHGPLSGIRDEVRDYIRQQISTLPLKGVGIDCTLDIAEDSPVILLARADYTIIKLDIQLATTADPDKQGIEVIDAFVDLTLKLPRGAGCLQSILGYLSPSLNDTCVLDIGFSVGTCVDNLKHAILNDK